MKKDILSKLKIEMAKKEIDEIRIIYFFSRIRKILELDKNKSNYKFLKFYCDWALHSQIDNTQPIGSMLEGMFGGDLNHLIDFSNFRKLDTDLKLFLKEYGIKAGFYEDSESIAKFKNILREIYTDTPLVIKEIKKWAITLKRQSNTKVTVSKTEIKE